MAAGLDVMRKTIREKEPVRPSTRLTQELVAAARKSAADLAAENSGALPRRRYGQVEELIRLLRGDLDWIVMKCLEKDRTRRYETANGLAADITRHLTNEPVVARPPSTAYRFQKAFRRNKFVFAAATAVAAALLAGIAVSTWQAFVAREAQQGEQIQRRAAQQKQAEA